MPLWKPLKYERAEDRATGALIFRVEGALTETPESYAFLEEVRGELQTQARPIVLNLARVDAMTSSGVGVIAAIYTSAVSRGVRVGVTQMTPRVKALFKLIHLHLLVSEYESEAEALAGITTG